MLNQYHNETIKFLLQKVQSITVIFQENKSGCLQEILQIFKQYSNLMSQQNNPQLVMFIMLKLGIVLSYMQYYADSIRLLKVSKRLASKHQDISVLMKGFKWLAINYIRLAKFELARSYLTKYLQAAWYCDSKKNEIKAYDLFGIFNYYAGNIPLAEHYYEKQIMRKLEGPTSDIKNLVTHNISTIQNKKKLLRSQNKINQMN